MGRDSPGAKPRHPEGVDEGTPRSRFLALASASARRCVATLAQGYGGTLQGRHRQDRCLRSLPGGSRSRSLTGAGRRGGVVRRPAIRRSRHPESAPENSGRPIYGWIGLLFAARFCRRCAGFTMVMSAPSPMSNSTSRNAASPFGRSSGRNRRRVPEESAGPSRASPLRLAARSNACDLDHHARADRLPATVSVIIFARRHFQ